MRVYTRCVRTSDDGHDDDDDDSDASIHRSHPGRIRVIIVVPRKTADQKPNGCRRAGERYCNGRAKKHTDASREIRRTKMPASCEPRNVFWKTTDSAAFNGKKFDFTERSVTG